MSRLLSTQADTDSEYLLNAHDVTQLQSFRILVRVLYNRISLTPFLKVPRLSGFLFVCFLGFFFFNKFSETNIGQGRLSFGWTLEPEVQDAHFLHHSPFTSPAA